MTTRDKVTHSESSARAILTYYSNAANMPLDEKEFYNLFRVRNITEQSHVDAVNSCVCTCRDGIVRVRKTHDACKDMLNSELFA